MNNSKISNICKIFKCFQTWDAQIFLPSTEWTAAVVAVVVTVVAVTIVVVAVLSSGHEYLVVF